MTNRRSRFICVFSAFIAMIAGSTSTGSAGAVPDFSDAVANLRAEQPQISVSVHDGRVSRVFGPAFATGENAFDTAERFLTRHAAVLGTEPHHLMLGNRLGNEAQLLVLDRDTGTFRFTAIYKRHVVDGVPVFDSYATLLMRNEPDNGCVLIVNDIRPIGEYRPPTQIRIDAARGRNMAGALVRGLDHFSDVETVIWAEEQPPRLAYTFIGEGFDPLTNVPRHEEFVFDAQTHRLLLRRNLIHHSAVGGHVTGKATPGLFPDTPSNPPQITPLASAQITGPGDPVITDADGRYLYPAAGEPSLTLTSTLVGPWAEVTTQQGPAVSQQETATPPAVVHFDHNTTPAELRTAQINAFLHTNVVRDHVVATNPGYPGMHAPLLVRTNINQNCNAYFTTSPLSINFYTSGGGCPNTAYSTVVYHEYGHYLIWQAGTGQGAYGEGMSDSIAIVVTDDPHLAQDFFGPGTGPMRTGINTVNYPCSGGIHFCGQVLSGAVWNLRQNLLATRPSEYRDVLSSLVVNSILLNPPGITPDLIVDFLTLDAPDGSFQNGTPHIQEIVEAFEAKNMPRPIVDHSACPGTLALPQGEFTFHNILTQTSSPSEPSCGGDFQRDLWFGHVADCDGMLEISLCGSEFPTKLGIYPFPCPTESGTILQCASSGCDDGNARITMPVAALQVVRLRVGSLDGTAGQVALSISCTPCPADFNQDGTVDVIDLLTLLDEWGTCIDGESCPADLNGDDAVDVLDLLMLLDAWGSCLS
jgi:hypothetical protein